VVIEPFVQFLISSAKEIGTSDIHILSDKENYFVYFRLNGRLEKKYTLNEQNGKRIISYFKYLANMDISERRKPQSGSLVYKLDETFQQDLRLSTITNYHGKESLVIRLLEIQADIPLENSTFLQHELQQLKQFVQLKSGLILFSGPVNSGKTTTMYQLVRNRIKRAKLQVVAIEDPVEIEEDNFLQIQVNEKTGNSYEESLKASLRHHPDVIIIGEIRDEETARMAVRGALTGHLILASVHAKDAEGVLSRMHELGISHEMLEQTIVAIVFQKLLPLHCALCNGNCQIYCSYYPINQKRAALYDLLKGDDIADGFSDDKKKLSESRWRNFNHLLKKVYAYGFINEEIYHQYYIP
jgi:competence protein ComGA